MDLARHYLQLRAPQALAYGQLHLNTEAAHVHLMISGNLLESGKKLRLSRSAFAAVKLELERYQRERYPELEHSRVDHEPLAARRLSGKPSPPDKPSLSEQERRRRLKEQGRGDLSHKEVLRDRVLQVLVSVSSEVDFFRGLADAGLSPYRRGRTLCVKDPDTGRKHRLKSLGLEPLLREASARWERARERIHHVEALELHRIRELVHGLGFGDDDAEVLSEPQDLAGEADPRLHELREVLRNRRQALRRTKDLGRDLE